MLVRLLLSEFHPFELQNQGGNNFSITQLISKQIGLQLGYKFYFNTLSEIRLHLTLL